MAEIPDPYDIPELERGVYRDESSWPGIIEYRIIDSKGHIMLRCEVAAQYDSEALQRRFSAWLKATDIGGHLRAI